MDDNLYAAQQNYGTWLGRSIASYIVKRGLPYLTPGVKMTYIQNNITYAIFRPSFSLSITLLILLFVPSASKGTSPINPDFDDTNVQVGQTCRFAFGYSPIANPDGKRRVEHPNLRSTLKKRLLTNLMVMPLFYSPDIYTNKNCEATAFCTYGH